MVGGLHNQGNDDARSLCVENHRTLGCFWKRADPCGIDKKSEPQPFCTPHLESTKKPLPGDVNEDPLTLCKRNLILMSTLCPKGYCFPPSDKAAEGQKEKGTGRNCGH